MSGAWTTLKTPDGAMETWRAAAAGGGRKPALAELSPKHEVVVYPDAGHGFFCDARSSYDASAAKDSWPKTLARFRAM